MPVPTLYQQARTSLLDRKRDMKAVSAPSQMLTVCSRGSDSLEVTLRRKLPRLAPLQSHSPTPKAVLNGLRVVLKGLGCALGAVLAVERVARTTRHRKTFTAASPH